MTTILLVLTETIALIAVVSAIQLTGLAFRNPFRPAWLRRKRTEGMASVLITGAIAFAMAFEIAGLVNAGLPVAAAIPVTVAMVFAVGYANWRLFDYGERLRRADAGQSPFYPVGRMHGPLGTSLGG